MRHVMWCVLQAFMNHSGIHWLSDPNHPHIEAGRRAIRHTFGMDPDMTRDGCSIPITLIMQVCPLCMYSNQVQE